MISTAMPRADQFNGNAPSNEQRSSDAYAANVWRADLWISGQAHAASSGGSFSRTNPVTSEIASVAAAATLDDVARAALSAAAAFPAWSRTSPEQRQAILDQAANLLISQKDAFTRVMMAETGATAQWCDFNVEYGANIFRDAASMADYVNPLPPAKHLATQCSFALRQPAGVCLAMAPWNAPILLAVRSIALALACGNTVILKTSELCAATQSMLGQLLQQAGLPDGVLNILSNAPTDASTIVEALIAHPVVRRVNFTGSTRVGRLIAQMGARHLKRCLLELGGKAPLIVLEDADLEEAAKAAAFGAFYNQGQICMSTERIILIDTIADDFMRLFETKAKELRADNPAFGTTPLGALISADSGRRIKALIDDAVTKGANVVTGGQIHEALMDATVIDHVLPTMRLYREESFGPVVSVIRVGDEDEAVTVANDCDYGLSGAVFSRDLHRALSVAQRVETGILHINSATVEDQPDMPFGGVKASGYGRFGGEAALDEFTELRWVTLSSGQQTYPI